MKDYFAIRVKPLFRNKSLMLYNNQFSKNNAKYKIIRL